MANEEHLEILRSGVKAWNEWREANANTHPDLSDAELNAADLRRINLNGVDLRRAKLFGANLRLASLECALLQEANLSTAKLTNSDLSSSRMGRANLNKADLQRCKLHGADLSDVDLSDAVLSDADLSEADLRGATISNTGLGNTNLTQAKGLEACLHLGPSTIDHRTLAKSGKLPVKFLRGCGLPDFIIGNIPVLQGAPLQFYSCFISHSNKDKEFAEQLHNDLQGKGVRCWYAPENLKIGDRFRNRISEAIRGHDKLLLILSDESARSEWVETEVENALDRERQLAKNIDDGAPRPVVLFPIQIDDVVLPKNRAWVGDIRRNRHIGDFRKWKDHDAYQKAFDRLLRDLKASA